MEIVCSISCVTRIWGVAMPRPEVKGADIGMVKVVALSARGGGTIRNRQERK